MGIRGVKNIARLVQGLWLRHHGWTSVAAGIQPQLSVGSKGGMKVGGLKDP